MNKTIRQIECLQRLQTLTNCQDDILSFLLEENLISKDQIKEVKTSPDQAKTLQILLTKLSSSNATQLLEYEWTLLPVERIKILIVTDRNSREFSYNF